MSFRWTAVVASAAIALASTASTLLGQGTPRSELTVSGMVLDHASGSPVVAALVQLFQPGEGVPIREALTDQNGRFQMDGLRSGEYRIRLDAFGFRELDEMVEFLDLGQVDLRVEMIPEALELDPVVVTRATRSRLDRAGFYERRQRGIGVYLTRDEILRRTTSFQVSEALRGIPGARVVMGPFGEPSRVQFRGGCEPDLFIDGSPTQVGTTVDEVLSVDDLEGLEVYRGITVPAQFTTRSGCGAIVAWTRQPGVVAGDPLTWARAVMGVGAILSTFIVAF
jgi:5-hydroxyisourate hydrolase-like protein (transthyretin family)